MLKVQCYCLVLSFLFKSAQICDKSKLRFYQFYREQFIKRFLGVFFQFSVKYQIYISERCPSACIFRSSTICKMDFIGNNCFVWKQIILFYFVFLVSISNLNFQVGNVLRAVNKHGRPLCYLSGKTKVCFACKKRSIKEGE